MIPAIEQHIRLVEEEIQKIKYPNQPENLYEPIRYFMSLGGKRMRPVLLMLGYELFGDDRQKILPQAAAIELFHNFTLIHDDIMDQAPIRRGKSTIHQKWNENIAILSGDALMVTAYQLLGKTDSKNFKLIFDLFNKTALEVCEGQQYDMDFENKVVTIEDYLEMIRLKTSVLLGASLEIGALLADAPKEDAEHLYLFGQHLGIAFQLQDDLLDAFGDPEKFGKKPGGDIAANKKTYLMLSAAQFAGEEMKHRLEQAIQEQNTEEKIRQVLSVFESIGVKEKTQQEMDKHFTVAKSHLEKVKVTPEKKQTLLELAESLMIRVN